MLFLLAFGLDPFKHCQNLHKSPLAESLACCCFMQISTLAFRMCNYFSPFVPIDPLCREKSSLKCLSWSPTLLEMEMLDLGSGLSQNSFISIFSSFFLFLQMNICDKPPNKTAPENLGEAGPKVQRARRNGWSWPLHPFQIITWLLYLFFALVGFGILVPLLPLHWLPAGYIVSFGQEQNRSCNELPVGHFKTSGEHRRKQLSQNLFLSCSRNVDFLLSLRNTYFGTISVPPPRKIINILPVSVVTPFEGFAPQALLSTSASVSLCCSTSVLQAFREGIGKLGNCCLQSAGLCVSRIAVSLTVVQTKEKI